MIHRAAAEVVAVAVATLLGSVEGVSVGKEEGCGVGRETELSVTVEG